MVGDVHGCFDRATALLERIGVAADGRWTAGDSHVIFIGDLMDRGPRGLDVVRLVMSLQEQAPDDGGKVDCTLGNHEIFLLGAHRFGERPIGPLDFSFYELWASNGGIRADIEGLGTREIDWMTALPSAVSLDGHLLVHCDSEMYAERGSTVEEVNDSIRTVIEGPLEGWDELIRAFVRRNELWSNTDRGRSALEGMLQTFGANKVVHGHTPIPIVTGQDAAVVDRALVYSEGRCVNIDGGMFMGSGGIAYELPLDEQ